MRPGLWIATQERQSLHKQADLNDVPEKEHDLPRIHWPCMHHKIRLNTCVVFLISVLALGF